MLEFIKNSFLFTHGGGRKAHTQTHTYSHTKAYKLNYSQGISYKQKTDLRFGFIFILRFLSAWIQETARFKLAYKVCHRN